MAPRIVFENPDGSVGVITPGKNTTLSIEEICAKDVPAGAAFEIVDESVLPDRTFRNAWVKSGPGLIGVDIAKAKKLAHDRNVEKRKGRLADFDLDEMPQRQSVKNEHSNIASAIDSATDETELLAAIASL